MNSPKLTVKQFNAMRAKSGLNALNALRDMSHDPMKINEALLMEILHDCKDTEYGKNIILQTFTALKTISGWFLLAHIRTTKNMSKEQFIIMKRIY